MRSKGWLGGEELLSVFLCGLDQLLLLRVRGSTADLALAGFLGRLLVGVP